MIWSVVWVEFLYDGDSYGGDDDDDNNMRAH